MLVENLAIRASDRLIFFRRSQVFTAMSIKDLTHFLKGRKICTVFIYVGAQLLTSERHCGRGGRGGAARAVGAGAIWHCFNFKAGTGYRVPKHIMNIARL